MVYGFVYSLRFQNIKFFFVTLMFWIVLVSDCCCSSGCCCCGAGNSLAVGSSVDDNVVDGSVSAGFASADDFVTKSFRCILVDFPHEIFVIFCFVVSGCCCIVQALIVDKLSLAIISSGFFFCFFVIRYYIERDRPFMILSHLFTKSIAWSNSFVNRLFLLSFRISELKWFHSFRLVYSSRMLIVFSVHFVFFFLFSNISFVFHSFTCVVCFLCIWFFFLPIFLHLRFSFVRSFVLSISQFTSTALFCL